MPTSIEELLDRAWDALDEESFEEAEALGRRALMIDAQSVDARLAVARALLNREDYRQAIELLREAVALEPTNAEIRTDLGIALFEFCEFGESRKNIEAAIELGDESPDAAYRMALCLERDGEYARAEEFFASAAAVDPQTYPIPKRLSREECLRAVEEARERLPREFDAALENVTILVEDIPSEAVLKEFDPPLDPCLLGLFVGVPLNEKPATGGPPALPDTVLIFQRNLERSCETHDNLVDELYVTLYHEIGHFMGHDEDEIEDLGFA